MLTAIVLFSRPRLAVLPLKLNSPLCEILKIVRNIVICSLKGRHSEENVTKYKLFTGRKHWQTRCNVYVLKIYVMEAWVACWSSGMILA